MFLVSMHYGIDALRGILDMQTTPKGQAVSLPTCMVSVQYSYTYYLDY